MEETFQLKVDHYTVIFRYCLGEPNVSEITIVHNMLILLGKWFMNKALLLTIKHYQSNEKSLVFENFTKLAHEKLTIYGYSCDIKQHFKKVTIDIPQ